MGDKKCKEPRKEEFFDKRAIKQEGWKHDRNKENPADLDNQYKKRKLAERESRQD